MLMFYMLESQPGIWMEPQQSVNRVFDCRAYNAYIQAPQTAKFMPIMAIVLNAKMDIP